MILGAHTRPGSGEWIPLRNIDGFFTSSIAEQLFPFPSSG